MGEKFIRKQPLLSKIKSYPFDILIYLNELALSIEWDDYADSIALALGVVLLMIYLVIAKILNYYDIVHSKSENILFQTNYNNYERLKARLLEKNITVQSYNYTFVRFLKWINILLFLASIIICFIIFRSTRNYRLLYCKEKPNTPSVKKSKLNHTKFIRKLWKFLGFETLFNNNDKYVLEVELEDDKEIFELNVWDPSKFLLFLEIPFNPLNLTLFQFYSVNFFLLRTLSTVTMVSVGIYLLIQKFLTLVNDKQILYQEMFSEFNNKFVKPKTSILKKDVSIDSTKGPIGSTVLTNVKPYSFSKLKVFVTHDANGAQVQHYLNDDLDQQSIDVKNSINNPSGSLEIFEFSKPLINNFHSIRTENENLKFKNEQLQKHLNYLARNPTSFDEKIEDLYGSKNFDPVIIESRERSLRSPSNFNVQSSKFWSPNVTRTPSPTKNRSRSSSPTKQFQSSPSPLRSTYRSPSRRGSDIYGRVPQKSPSLRGFDRGFPDLSPEVRNTEFRKSPVLRNNDSKSPFLRSDGGRSPQLRTSKIYRSPSPSSERPLDKSHELKPRWR